MYSPEEIMDYVEQEDVKFVRLAFCDIYGKQKNIAVVPETLKKAFEEGISFDASAIAGFEDEVKSDLFLFPISSTLTVMPWRSMSGKVVKMFTEIRYPNGEIYEKDSRQILKQAIKAAGEMGIMVDFGAELEFYLFKTDEEGNPTKIPLDTAGYMDVAPLDKGENVRREISLTLREMGIIPECSHHEEGPGQNEIDFRHSDAMRAADNVMNFKSVVRAVAQANGLFADFTPKPLENAPGNGMHINMSLQSFDGKDYTEGFMAGILAHIKEITAFLNNGQDSYKRLGENKAPKYITWSEQNRNQLIRIPSTNGNVKRIELRSPDPWTNPYIVFALLIHSGLDGIKKNLSLQPAVDIDLKNLTPLAEGTLEKLPMCLDEAVEIAKNSEFVRNILPDSYFEFIDR